MRNFVVVKIKILNLTTNLQRNVRKKKRKSEDQKKPKFLHLRTLHWLCDAETRSSFGLMYLFALFIFKSHSRKETFYSDTMKLNHFS
jgi:hypothetical protein